jgi:hypothetical protein
VWFQADPFDRIKERVQDPSKHFIAFALESVAFGGIGDNEQSGGNDRMVDVVLQDCSQLEADAIRAKLKGQFVANSGGVTIGSAWFLAIYAQVDRCVFLIVRTWHGVQIGFSDVPSGYCVAMLSGGHGMRYTSVSWSRLFDLTGDGGHDERRLQIPTGRIASPGRSSAAQYRGIRQCQSLRFGSKDSYPQQ